MNKRIKHIKLAGSSRQIGLKHGRQLKDRIASTWQFYSKILFQNKLGLVEDLGIRYLAAIRDFSEEYGREIEAVAEGSNLPSWQIAALNARTEIYHALSEPNPTNECTAFYLPGNRILGQNWDWMEQLQPLVVLMEIERGDGHRILQLTEPGIIGKIGFNSEGIGVCLNMLNGGASPVAVPIHILLRSALDARDIGEAYHDFNHMPHGTYSNILMADDKGGHIDMEYADTRMRSVDYQMRRPVHTNHYLSELKDTQEMNEDFPYENSVARFRRGRELVDNLDGDAGADSLKTILRDRADSEYPICRSYKTGLLGLQAGTVSSIVMDLPNRKMHIALGNRQEDQYQVYPLSR